MKRMIALSLLVLAPLSAPAAAAPMDSSATAQNAVAVKTLEAAARLNPSDGGTCIELAYAYLRAGRPADATIAYHRALKLDNVMLETKTGDAIWSHQVAQYALSGEMQLSAR